MAAWNKDDTLLNFLTLGDGYHLLTIPDSSLRLPATFDPGTLQSPGFNPVNFFAATSSGQRSVYGRQMY